MGQTAPLIEKAFNKHGSIECHRVCNMEEAVAMSKKISQKNGVVLLSPACASWDMYKNYEERGDHFKSAVNQLMG